MTVTNNYLNKQELVDQKVPGSKAVVLSGFDNRMNPVYGARLLATDINNDAKYIKKTFGSLFVKENIEANSTYIRHSGDASFLFDKQNEQVASWAWNTVDLSIPDTIRPTLEIIKGILDPLKNLLAVIKEALQILVNATIGITEALRVLIEEVITTITSALEWFNIEVSLHTLFVPPIVPSGNRKDMAALVDASSAIVKGLASAVNIVSPDLAKNINSIPSKSIAGNKGFYKLVTDKLADGLDTNRPQFSDSNFIAGCVIMFGYPVEELYNIYYRILDVFKAAPIPKYSGSLKPLSILETHYIKSLGLVSIKVSSPLKESVIRYSLDPLKIKKRKHYIVLYTESVSKSTIADTTRQLDTAHKVKDLPDILPELEIITRSEPEFLIASSEVYDSNIFDIIDFDIYDNLKSGGSYKYDVYSYYMIDELDKATNLYVEKVVLVRGGQGSLNVPAYGKFQVNYGSGRAPQWVQVNSMFDLFDVLGTVRDVLGLVRKYVNGFFSKVASILKTILEELTRYLNFISSILTKLDRVLDLLKALAGLGVGGSILMFQGEGGNSTLTKILKNSLIDRPSKLYDKADTDSPRPSIENMSLEHSNWVQSKKNISKYYSALSRQFSSLDFSSDSYAYAGSFPPNFSDTESVAGLVMVGGGDSIDNVTKLFNLLKSLLTSDKQSEDSDLEFSEDMLSALGIDPSAFDILNNTSVSLDSLYPTSTDINNDFIPGAYTQAMEAAKSPSDMLEDYCNR